MITNYTESGGKEESASGRAFSLKAKSSFSHGRLPCSAALPAAAEVNTDLSPVTPEETPENIPEQQPVARKDRVSCEVNSIGATGAKPQLAAMTTICVGARTG